MPSATEIASTVGGWTSFIVPSLFHELSAYFVHKFRQVFTDESDESKTSLSEVKTELSELKTELASVQTELAYLRVNQLRVARRTQEILEQIQHNTR